MTENALANIPIITQAILDAQPLGFHMRKLDELQVLRFMADKMRANVELKNDIAEAQLIIYRNAGLRFPDLFKRGGNGSNQHYKGAKRTPIRLADYGIDNRIADICRKLAALPEQRFEDMILGIRQKEHITHQEITTAFFYKAGRIHIMRSNGISTDKPQPSPQHTPESIAALAREHLLPQQIEHLIKLLRG